jgi:hypothetical protein
MNDTPNADRVERRGRSDCSPSCDDYLDEHGLRSLGLEEASIERLLRISPLLGDGGRPIIEANRLPELLDSLQQEDGR